MKNTKENTYILYFEEGLCLQDHHEHIYDIDPKHRIRRRNLRI